MNTLEKHSIKFGIHLDRAFPDLDPADIRVPISYYLFKTWDDVTEAGNFYSDNHVTYYGFIEFMGHKYFIHTIPEKIHDPVKIMEDSRIDQIIKMYIRERTAYYDSILNLHPRRK